MRGAGRLLTTFLLCLTVPHAWATEDRALADHREMVRAIYAGDVERVEELLESPHVSRDRYWEYSRRSVTSARVAGILGQTTSRQQYEIARKFVDSGDFDVNHRPRGQIGRGIPDRVAFAYFGDGLSDGSHHLAFLEHLLSLGAETSGIWYVAQNGCDDFFSLEHHRRSEDLARLAAQTCESEPAQCTFPDYEIEEDGSGYRATGDDATASEFSDFLQWRVSAGNGSCSVLLDLADDL